MKGMEKKQIVSLAIRVGVVFLTTVIAVIMVAYYVLSQNFKVMLTDYTITLLKTMTAQGVEIIETEIANGKQEIILLAESFQIPDSHTEISFPHLNMQESYVRMIYMDDEQTTSSDRKQKDIRNREDIVDALHGETKIYGPYFNEDGEYVICYSTPVFEQDEIVGVLSIEKDGYKFCELIENILFINSGESYIINADGTDIAVSDQDHIDWVNSQYNARLLLEQEMDEETKSVFDLEQKGLQGETGVGTYYWENGLCYVCYQPIPSTGWVLLAGLREEELVAMTHSTVLYSIANNPIFITCFIIVLILAGIIVYWIIANMKKIANINDKLDKLANCDTLTGLLNRNSFHTKVDELTNYEQLSLGCIYMDANGLHELNNYLGHQAGDEMLIAIAKTLKWYFPADQIYRIGGDEFIVLIDQGQSMELSEIAEQVRTSLLKQNYEISIGIAYEAHVENIMDVVNAAEAEMQRDKQLFYRSKGNEKRLRIVDKRLEQMLEEKQDTNTLFAVLAPEFKGVYFVNLIDDSIHHIYIPSYFEDCLEDSEDKFSKAIMLYAQRIVKPEFYHLFQEFSDYEKLERRLENGETPEYTYQKNSGEWLKLKILKFRNYTRLQKETLWIFTELNEEE